MMKLSLLLLLVVSLLLVPVAYSSNGSSNYTINNTNKINNVTIKAFKGSSDSVEIKDGDEITVSRSSVKDVDGKDYGIPYITAELFVNGKNPWHSKFSWFRHITLTVYKGNEQVYKETQLTIFATVFKIQTSKYNPYDVGDYDCVISYNGNKKQKLSKAEMKFKLHIIP